MTNLAGSSNIQDDVDALAGQLVGHRRDARAAHADACALRVGRGSFDLTAIFARMPGSRAAALISISPSSISGTSSLEQAHQEFRRNPRQDQLRPFAVRSTFFVT
jgi:hypothetical protein